MWCSLALAGAILVSRRWSVKQVLGAVGIIAAICLPTVFAALSYVGGKKVSDPTHFADWLVVVFRNPHHLDPAYFGGTRELVRLAIKLAATALAAFYCLRGFKRYLAIAIPTALVLEFAAGLAAWHWQQLWLLKAYPFRVPDTLVVLLASLLVAQGVVAVVQARLNPKLGKALFASPLGCAAVALIAVAYLAVAQHSVVRGFTRSWSEFLQHRQSTELAMEDWVKHNTPEDAIFITPPWVGNFFFEAGRAEMVTFKRNPHNYLILQWYERYAALNGGPFHSIGTATVEETRVHYPQLSLAELSTFHQRYQADFYLTQSPRTDLGAPVYQNRDFFLYRVP